MFPERNANGPGSDQPRQGFHEHGRRHDIRDILCGLGDNGFAFAEKVFRQTGVYIQVPFRQAEIRDVDRSFGSAFVPDVRFKDNGGHPLDKGRRRWICFSC